ncbi:PEP/pyruvate-binding domain-containing protein [Austwickia chelonae]|uniref:PEP/pyruvate-binding domain-containing protein n=1 Tax=Austwickia chelonae TaxID=100225 RepID=UPI000E22B8DB|nr:PEP/pyruvate-binding domain-containing protein [Austwickia chelonae]
MTDRVALIPLVEAGVQGVSQVGGKAARLGVLLAQGFPVPPGVCVPTGVYAYIVAPVVKQTRRLMLGSGHNSPGEIAAAVREAVRAVQLPDHLVADLALAVTDLDDGRGVAVRSSGTAEDVETASWAGLYSTTLRVSGVEQVVAAVRECWASQWSDEALAYHAGLTGSERMAILIQSMVDAHAAGVMFIPKEPGGAVIVEAVRGVADRLVDGTIDPERHVLHPGELPASPVATGAHHILGREDLAALRDLGTRVRATLGGGQDVEWAWPDGGELQLLQARPITRDVVVPPAARWESPVSGAAWARISICDSWLPGPLSPLFATTVFPALVERWAANWAGSRNNPLVPHPMHGTVEGYAYLRIDFPLNRHPLLAARLIHSFFRFHLSPVERVWRDDLLPRHRRRISELAEIDVRGQRPQALLDVVDELTDLSARYWALIGGLAWYWNVGEWVLARLFPRQEILRQHGAQAEELTYTTLLQGRDSLSHQAQCLLHDIAMGCPDDLETGLDEYRRRFGHLVYHLDIAEPTPAEDLSAAREIIRAFRDGATVDPRQRHAFLERRRREALADARRALPRLSVRRQLFEATLRWSEHWSDVRDQSLHGFTLAWPLIREAYLELGRRAVATGALVAAEDVFFLRGDELRSWVADPQRTDTSPWVELVRDRIVERERRRLLTPPMTVPPDVRVQLGPWNITGLALFGQEGTAASETQLRGSGVSGGRVRGHVRRLQTVQEAHDVTTRVVLVVPHLTPAWSPVVARVGAVVTDVGGSLSHGSIVARELGVPAVMGTGCATKVLRDGDQVEVDGTRGVVTLCGREDPPP